MLVDFSAGFIDIMSRLAERVTNRVVFPFASDNDSFTRLIRTYRPVLVAVSVVAVLVCAKASSTMSAQARAIIVFFTVTPPFFLVDVYLCFLAPGFNGQLPRRYSKQYMNWAIEQALRFVNVRC